MSCALRLGTLDTSISSPIQSSRSSIRCFKISLPISASSCSGTQLFLAFSDSHTSFCRVSATAKTTVICVEFAGSPSTAAIATPEVPLVLAAGGATVGVALFTILARTRLVGRRMAAGLTAGVVAWALSLA